MAQRETGATADGSRRYRVRPVSPADSFGAVLVLTVLDYLAVSTLLDLLWGRVVVNILLGLTLLFSLRTSRSRPIWQLLAVLYLLSSVAAAVAAMFGRGAAPAGQWATTIAWLLLLAAPMVILRRISAHRFVTTETVLGAVCVYLLLGFSFTAIYAAIGALSAEGFFVGVQSATVNQYLFFSYTTLTTVGYGNLVPASNLGQTFAMIEALSGQIYLVIIVARLVSLWQRTPEKDSQPKIAASAADAERHNPSSSTAPVQ